MWSFHSRYDWAMPRHRESGRHTLGLDVAMGYNQEIMRSSLELAGSETQQQQWKREQKHSKKQECKTFAEAIYKYAANEYHETYLSWKSIIWLQNILEKKKIPFMFTLADNSLFYEEFDITRTRTIYDCTA